MVPAPVPVALAAACGLAAGGVVERRAASCALAALPASRGRRQVPARRSRPRGLAVRTSCALLLVVVVASCGLTLEAAELAVLACCLVALSLADALALVIPNGCVALAAVARLAYLALDVATGRLGPSGLLVPLMRAAGVALLLLLASLLACRLLGHVDLGGGDVKLLAVAALYLEPDALLAATLLACLLGVAQGLAQGLAQGHRGASALVRPFPWGPAISLSLWLSVMAGASLA